MKLIHRQIQSIQTLLRVCFACLVVLSYVVSPACHCNESWTDELSHHEENRFVTQTNPTVHCDSEHHPDTPEPCQNEDCFCCIAKLPSKLMCLSIQAEMVQPLPNWYCLVRPDLKFPPLIPPPKHA